MPAPRPNCEPASVMLLQTLRSVGPRLSEFTERWVPDAWVICMMLTAFALLLSVVGAGASPEAAVVAWG